MKDTDTLIEALAAEPTVKTVRLTPVTLFALWAAALSAYVVLVFLTGILKLRPDAAAVLMQRLFADEITGLVLLILATALSAALLSFPDYGRGRLWVWPPAAAFAFFLITLVLSCLFSGPSVLPPHDDMLCLGCILILAVLPAALMFWQIRRMATVRPDRAGMLCAICAFSVGALILRLSEQTDDMTHIIMVHYLPMLAVSALGFWLGARLLKW